MKPTVRSRRVRMPERRAASSLPPIAYMKRPISVASSRIQRTSATASAIQTWLLSPSIDLAPRSTYP